MKRCLLITFLISFLSCKSLVHNDRVISYNYIGEKSNLQIVGDSQELAFTSNDKIRIMPAYFREYGSLKNSIVVRIRIDKKYAFRNLGSVLSKEFGALKITPHEWIRKNESFDDIIFSKSLKEIDLMERKQRILKDTLTVKLGKIKLSLTPRQYSESNK